MKNFNDLCYNEAHQLYLDVHLPKAHTFPVLIYFHGGGLERGDKSRAEVFFESMTNRGIAVVSANYRMYPDAKYPEFVFDAAEAVSWVFQNIHRFGNAEKIFVGGSSAGGYLSQMLCYDESYLKHFGISLSSIAGFILDAGQPTCHFRILKERGIDSRRVIVDESAPLYHIEEGKAYPPMQIIVSDQDMQNRYEQTMLLVSTLKHFGYEELVSLVVMKGKHCAYVKRMDENGENVFTNIVAPFILSHC